MTPHIEYESLGDPSHPAIVLIMGLVFSVTSYHDMMIISFTACYEQLPDPQVFAQCLRDSFQEYLALVRPTAIKTPPRKARPVAAKAPHRAVPATRPRAPRRKPASRAVAH